MSAVREHVAAGGLLISGTASSVLNKIIYGLKGRGLAGDVKKFEKPWASTALMFAGMALCLPLSLLLGALSRTKKKKYTFSEAAEAATEAREPLLSADSGHTAPAGRKTQTRTKEMLLIAAPTLFDLAATLLMSIGLLSVTASVYQMLRGAEMLFAAFFSVTWLKRSLNGKHYLGLGLCFAGILLVGASSLMGGAGGLAQSAGATAAGMLLIVLAQAVQAAQVTMEDHVLRDLGMAPLTVVGWEGIWGCIFMFGVLLPVAQLLPGRDGGGVHEDSRDTLHMIGHSIPPWAIPSALVTTGVSLLLYNITGMFVTDQIGAVARTVLESLRTMFVWGVDLVLYYAPVVPKSLGHIGEKWDNSSYLQAFGFLVLIAGTLVYSKGDELQEKEQAAMEGAGLVRKPPPRRAFSQASSIAGWSRHSAGMGRWRAAIHAAVAESRLRAAADRSGHHTHV